jgi:DNA gyrase subunit A
MEGDFVVGMVVADPEGFLLTVCENGHGKRTPFGANTASDEPADDDVETGKEEPETPAPPAEGEGEGEEGEEPKDRSGMRYRKQRRGGKGLRDIRATERNGPVVGVTAVTEADDIMLITTQGMVNRTHVAEIRLVGRNTQGVRIMNLNEGDKIASIAKVAREEEDGEAPPPGPADAATDDPGPDPAPEM